MNQPVLNDYMDYRAFLKDMFTYKKKTDRYFSYRYFSRRAGITSPNFLQLVISGKRNLTQESAAKICKGFDLKKTDREYFENLVWLNQSTTHEDRNHYYRKIVSLKSNASVRKLDKASYEYFSKWFYPAIREVISLGNHKWDAEKISNRLDPEIAPKDAEKALKALIDLGLISRDSDGVYRQNESFLTTGPEVQSLAVANFHREMLRLATESIERHNAEVRDISSLTISIRSERVRELKEHLSRIRHEIMKMYCEDKDCDQVYQLNLQLFPLSRKLV
jgi:uncharacterized protein (TIGR02147 family)